MPRASPRSVLTVIAESAARTCLVSISTAARPYPARPRTSHSESGPASRPSRTSCRRYGARQAASASGSLATTASRTVRPSREPDPWRAGVGRSGMATSAAPATTRSSSSTSSVISNAVPCGPATFIVPTAGGRCLTRSSPAIVSAASTLLPRRRRLRHARGLRVPGREGDRVRDPAARQRGPAGADRSSAQAAGRPSAEQAAGVLRELQLPGAELDQAAPGRCQGRVAPGRAVPARRLHRHQPDAAGRAGQQVLQRPRHRRAVDVWTPPALQVHSLVVRHEQVSCCYVFGLRCGHLAAGLDEIRGQLPIIKASSKLFTALGFCCPRSDRSRHRLKERHRSSWKRPALVGNWKPSWQSCAGCSSSQSSVKQAHDRSHRG